MQDSRASAAPSAPHALHEVVPNLLVAGLLLGLLEVGWVFATAGDLFLSFAERALYAVTALVSLGGAVMLLGCVVVRASHSDVIGRVGRLLFALTGAIVASGLFWSVSDGRRVRDLAARPAVVAAFALACGAALFFMPRTVRRAEKYGRRARLALVVSCALACTLLLVADARLFPRTYPAFHLGLALLGVLCATVGGLLAPSLRVGSRACAIAAALALLSAPFALARVAAHPTASFAVREQAPWTAKLMSSFTPTPRIRGTRATVSAAAARARSGVDLRDRDILLITVDALRADLLRAYGGKGETPALDALASESAVFTRAYTPAPHTSYALASMLTGKFVKPLVELEGALGDPPTLPDRLRRYGYRTAAFYPPAVFFVDGASFAPLAARGFGFEYRKEMFASADQRVAQLDAYLAQAEPRPLFVWMHLFEPHEPYDPPADIVHDGSERGRYVAEVKACDRAIAKLVERFRAARPNATVIVTADHGEEFGDHGGSFHGSSLYDEQVRVPLLWSSPGVLGPRTIAAPVELCDVGTTILSTAGIPRDAHMRGDDLAPLLAGDVEGAPRFAFASIDARHMVTNGEKKAICGADEQHCALFDLVGDPRETRNLAGREPNVVATLRGELDGFLASIPRVEALTASAGVKLPQALARAKLGGAGSSEELVPLLAHAEPSVRAEAARVLGERGFVSACSALEQARLHDGDARVRTEAAIAALRLGEQSALADVLALVAEGAATADRERARLAALALARFRRIEALPVLRDLALDEQATEAARVQAVRALGTLGESSAFDALVRGLDSVRLREEAAAALATLGDARAIPVLRAQLEGERYPPARRAEASALLKLGDAKLAPLLRRVLGRESSVPEGVRILAELGALSPSSQSGALFADESARQGSFDCTDAGCMPREGASVRLPARGERARGPVRVVLSYADATPGATLRVDGEPHVLSTAAGQLSFVRSSAASAERFALSAEGALRLVALVVVPARAELPPPAPEPWDGGVGDGSMPVAAVDERDGGSALPSR